MTTTEENQKWALRALGITAAMGVIGYISYKLIHKEPKPRAVTASTPQHKAPLTKLKPDLKQLIPSSSPTSKSHSSQINLDTSSWLLYDGTSDGIRFKYPPQFQNPKTSKIEFVQAKIISFEYEGDPSVVHFSVEERMTDSVEDYVDVFLQMLQPSLGFKMIEKIRTTVAGRNAIEVEVEARQPNSSQLLRIWFLFFDSDRLVYHFRYQKKQNQEFLFQVVKKMISTLEVSPVPYVGTVDFYGNVEIRLPFIYITPQYNSEDDFILLDAVSNSQHSVMGVKITSKRKRDFTSTLESFVTHRKSELQNYFSNLKEITLKNLQLPFSFVCLTYEELVQDKICQFVEVLFLQEEYTIIVTGYSESKNFELFLTEFESSLNTLRFSLEKKNQSYCLYKNSLYGFSIRFEIGCELIEHLGTNPVLSLIHLEGGDINEELGEEEVKFNQTGLSILDCPTSVTTMQELKDFLKKEVEKLDQFGQLNLQIKSESIQKWNHIEAVQITHSRMDPQTSRNLTFIDTTLIRGSKLYTISSYTFSHMFTREVETILKQRHESLEFL